jgi:hypothetical protein
VRPTLQTTRDDDVYPDSLKTREKFLALFG